MTPETVLTIGRDALGVTVLLSAPMLLAALATGLLIGLFQAATQINEQTLSFIPKLLAMFLALLATAPWMLQILLDYTRLMIVEVVPRSIGG
jgi:flagellar biosynthetic protein FliQ